jgi:hypothetical protein
MEPEVQAVMRPVGVEVWRMAGLRSDVLPLCAVYPLLWRGEPVRLRCRKSMSPCRACQCPGHRAPAAQGEARIRGRIRALPVRRLPPCFSAGARAFAAGFSQYLLEKLALMRCFRYSAAVMSGYLPLLL